MQFKITPLSLVVLSTVIASPVYSAVNTPMPESEHVPNQAKPTVAKPNPQAQYIQKLIAQNKAQAAKIAAQSAQIKQLEQQKAHAVAIKKQTAANTDTATVMMPANTTVKPQNTAANTTTPTNNPTTTGSPSNDNGIKKPGNWFDFNSPVPVDFHGFATAGAGVSSSKQPYQAMEIGNIDNKPRLNNIQLGVQMNAHITQKVSVVGQLVANNASQNNGDFKVNPDWAFINYQATPNLSLSAGRMRIPIYLYASNFYDGTSYPWVSPPAEVYNLMPIYNFNGGQLTWTTPLGQSAWSSTTKLYGGYVHDTVNIPFGPSTLDSHDMIGFDTELTNNIVTFNLAATHFRFNITQFPQVPITVKNSYGNLITAGTEINYHHFFTILEGGVRNVSYEIPSNRAAYLTFGYNYHKWQPSLTFAALRTSSRANRPPSYPTQSGQYVDLMNTSQDSLTADLKYHYKPNVTFTLEDEYVHPTQGSFGFFSGFRNGDHLVVGEPLPGNVNIVRASVSTSF